MSEYRAPAGDEVYSESETFEDYDRFVQSMWMNDGAERTEQICIATLGLAGEAGEAAEKVKKFLRGDVADGKLTYEQHLKLLQSELGDVLFYVTKLALLHGWSLRDIADGNVIKLLGRRERTGTLRGNGDER